MMMDEQTNGRTNEQTNAQNDRQPKSYIAPPPFQSGAINMSVSSQDIERKQNFGLNQGPYLWYKCAKNDM